MPCQPGDIYLTSYWVNEETTPFPAGIVTVASIFVDVLFSDNSTQRLFPAPFVSTSSSGYVQVQGTFQIPYLPGKIAQSYTVALYLQVTNNTTTSISFDSSASVWARFDDVRIWKQISIDELNDINAAIATLTTNGQTSAAAFVDAEKPAGSIDGTNSTFTLAAAPNPPGSLQLYLSGVEQTAGRDYSLSSNQLTFVPLATPQIGDLLVAFYRVAGTGPGATFTDAETPTGSINGVNATFQVSAIPTPALSLKLYDNGVLMSQNADYTLNGAFITFTAAAVPQPGDALIASYRH